MSDDGYRIAEAILELARAQQAEADATTALVDIRRQELLEAATARAAVERLREADQDTIAAFKGELTKVGPALELLVTIAKAMRGER